MPHHHLRLLNMRKVPCFRHSNELNPSGPTELLDDIKPELDLTKSVFEPVE